MDDLPDLDFQACATSVIARAIEDVTCKHNSLMHSRPTDEEIRSAYLFLCSNRQPFYSDRETWCYLAGIDPQILRRKVLYAIENGIEYRLSEFTEASE